MIEDIIKYVGHSFKETKKQYPYIDDSILKSCLVYQFLHHKHFNELQTIENILHAHKDIGLIGPGNGCFTRFLESTLGWIDTLQTHGILHDAFGRFYVSCSLDRGYCYALSENATSKLMKRSPLCGQISGILYCIFKRIIV